MVNVAMWGKALRVIPRIEKAEWNALDPISRWLIATRSAVFVITLVSCGFAGLLAARDGAFSLPHFLAMTVGLTLAHATNNLLNDLTDHWKGVDKGNYFRAQYGPQPLEHGLLTVRQLLGYAALTGALALACGAWLILERGQTALLLTAVGAFFVLFYTWPLKYIGLGEPAVLAVWGPLMIGGGYFVTTGHWSNDVAWLSLPYALGATTVLFGKHIDKLDADRAKGIRTLPVILGDRLARATTIGMVVAMYGAIAALVATGTFAPTLLVVFAALPKAKQLYGVYRAPKPAGPPSDYPPGAWPLWFSAFAFVHNRTWGGLFLLGLLADVIGHRLGWF